MARDPGAGSIALVELWLPQSRATQPSAETKMHSGRRRAIQFNRDREFRSKRLCHRAVVGSTAFAEVDGPHDPQSAQGGVVKSATALEISHAKRYMVQHIVALRDA